MNQSVNSGARWWSGKQAEAEALQFSKHVSLNIICTALHVPCDFIDSA